MQPLGHAACNPNITSIIITPITTNTFETNSFLILWRNVKYFEIWTVFIDFVNDDDLFRIVVIEIVLPTTSSYSDWVFLAVTLRLQWDFWIRQKSSGSVVARVLPEPDRLALTQSPRISGAFNALPICDSRVGHLFNGLWGSHGDMKPFRPFIMGLKSHLYPWRTHLWRLIFHGAPLNYIRMFQSPHGHLM